MTIKLTQEGEINFIQTGTTTASNSIADIRITNNSTSGTTFMTMTTAGNIGIGTTSPIIKLDILNSGNGIRIKNAGGGTTSTYMGFSNNTESSLFYVGLDGVGYGGIETNAGLIATWTNNPVIFATNTTERMRINSSGNIGIGTSSPSSRLHVVGSGGTNGSMLITGTDNFGHSLYIGGADAQKRLVFNHQGTVGNIFCYNYTSLASQNLALQAYGGNVGIGTTNVAARLHVHASTWPNITLTTDDANVNSIELDSTNKTGGKKWRLVSSHGTAGEGQGNFFIQNGTDAINPFFIKANGNVGIGTSNPSHKLDVNGGITGREWFRVVGTGGFYWESYGRGIQSADSAGAIYGNISIYGTGMNSWGGYDIFGRYTFMANGETVGIHDKNASWVWEATTSRMFINRSVGIGTNSPNTILDVVSSSPIITIRQSDNSSGKIYFGNSSHGVGRNAQIGTLTAQNDVTFWTAGDGSVGFCTSLTERMRINSSGSVGIGTSSPAQRLDVHGNIGRVLATGDMHGAAVRNSLLHGRWDGASSDDYFTGTKYVVTNGEGYANSTNVQWWTWANSISMSREVGKIDHFGRNYNASGTYAAYSDIKLKENIETARDYLDDVCQLRVVKYSLKSEHQQEADKLGFIAQEVEEIFPNLVNEIEYSERNEEGDLTTNMIKAVKTSILIPMLVKCVQQLKAENNQLKTFIQNKFPGEI
jgi:hypothetical protein